MRGRFSRTGRRIIIVGLLATAMSVLWVTVGLAHRDYASYLIDHPLQGWFEESDYPGWIPASIRSALPRRAERPVSIDFICHAANRPVPIDDEVIAVFGKLPKLRDLNLTGAALTDSQLRQLLRHQPRLESLMLAGSPITADVLDELKAMPQLTYLVIDSPEISTDELIVATRDDPRGLMSGAINRRLAQLFVGGRDRSHAYQSTQWSGHAAVGSDGRLLDDSHSNSDGAPRAVGLRNAEINSDRLTLSSEGPVSVLDEETIRLFKVAGPFHAITLRNIDLSWMEDITLRAHRVVVDGGTGPLIAALNPSASLRELYLWDWRDGDGPLSRLNNAGLQRFRVHPAADGQPLTGAFLKTARLPHMQSLSLRGSGGVGEPMPLNLGRFERLSSLDLAGVAVAGESLWTLPRGQELRELNLEDVPHVTSGDLVATIHRTPPGNLHLGPGSPLDGDLLRAIAPSSIESFSFHESMLSPGFLFNHPDWRTRRLWIHIDTFRPLTATLVSRMPWNTVVVQDD